MLEVIAKRRVDFVLAGHLHHASWSFSAHADRALGRSILLIQASTATSSRRRGQPNAFNVIDLVPSELRLTNRLVLQPLVEVNLFGKSDPERSLGAGLSTTDAGLRLRYEVRREFAPYVGVSWNHKWGETADLAEAAGEDTGGARFVAGLRLWF
jgi:hypothetical protein